MNELREKLQNQEQQNQNVHDLLQRKFNIDSMAAPEFSFDHMMSLKKERKKQQRIFGFRIFKFSFTAALCLAILSVGIFFGSQKIQQTDHPQIELSQNDLPDLTIEVKKEIEKLEKSDRIANSNKLQKVTLLYDSGKTQVEKDAPIPMVWIRKGE